MPRRYPPIIAPMTLSRCEACRCTLSPGLEVSKFFCVRCVGQYQIQRDQAAAAAAARKADAAERKAIREGTAYATRYLSSRLEWGSVVKVLEFL